MQIFAVGRLLSFVFHYKPNLPYTASINPGANPRPVRLEYSSVANH